QEGTRAVVVSAMEGVTDQLLKAMQKVRGDEAAVRPAVQHLQEHHEAALEEAGLSKDPRLRSELDELFARFERLLYGIAYTAELTPKTQDLGVSFGERWSARILSACVRGKGLSSEPFDADQLGVLTDGTFGAASPILPAIEERLQRSLVPRMQHGLIPVVTGYFGADADGNVTTFGRGGSDFSGAILANALGAERLEVWKDVDGFLTADPRIVPGAQPIREMSYDEAAELAYLGAEVLHARTVEPVMRKGIPVLVRNTNRPEAEGTRIGPGRGLGKGLRSVAVRDHIGILKLYGPGMGATPGVGRKVFDALAYHRINVINMAASAASFALVVEQRDLDRAQEVVRDVAGDVIQNVEGIPDMSMVLVVGKGIGETPGTAGRIFQAVGEAGVNVEMISVGASDIALSFIVRTAQRTAAVHAVHDAFLAHEEKRRL
ncbi:MAG: aspartate kinase, partial [Halobacteriales archaeon]|nr:aspartate kinase [Halobacteriales archaeon]